MAQPLDRRAVLGGVATGLVAVCASGLAEAAMVGAIVDPRDFGARGVGATVDDTPAIQRAIDAAWRRGGGAVRFAATSTFYNLRSTIVCRPGVSLIGDGQFPRLRCADPSIAMLLAGNIHPDFLARARYDPVVRPAAGDRKLRLSGTGAAARYRVGDQVHVASVANGESGGYPVPLYGWLNIVQRIQGDTLWLREPIDRSVDAHIMRLRDTPARHGIPLFFHADARIAGLDLEAAGDVMSDSAMLRVAMTGNRVKAVGAIYGNCFQYVRWTDNDFRFTKRIGEQSCNSLATLTTRNRFSYDASGGDLGEAGFYFQEYGRKLMVVDNDVDIGAFPRGNFLVSIGLAQDVVVQRLRVRGQSMASLLYMGAAGSRGFAVSGNFIRDCRFDVARSVRFAMVHGEGSPFMHGNGITGCTFTGSASVPDAFRVEGGRGAFAFAGNRWNGKGECLTMGGTTGVSGTGNIAGPRREVGCRAI